MLQKIFLKQLWKDWNLEITIQNKKQKKKTDANRTLYKKQSCVYLLRKSKTNYYANLDEKKKSDNKIFWKVIKPSLSDKSCVKEEIKEKMLETDLETADVLNSFFWKYSKKSWY